MKTGQLVVALPIADRKRSYEFYVDKLGFAPVGEPAEDGIPEPLQFTANEGVRVMLVPTGGFGWVVGGREVSSPGQHECVLCIECATGSEVDEWLATGEAAGASIVSRPGEQPWAYAVTFTDPDGHLWMFEHSNTDQATVENP